jgi:signal transduction histidine kinase
MPIDVSAIAADVVRELREDAAYQRQNQPQPAAVVDVDIAAGMRAVGDPVLIRIVLTNLLSNAWKFTSHRRQGQEARIEIGQHALPPPPPDEMKDQDAEAKPDAGYATFFVRDNSAGFDMAQANKLFGVFQRLALTATSLTVPTCPTKTRFVTRFAFPP